MTNGLPFVKCYVKLFLAIFLWLISADSHAVEITSQRVLAANLQQPVGVIADKPIFLDAKGLHFENAVVENEGAALSIFAYKNEIWTANPIKRELSRFDNSGKLTKKIDVSQTAESKNPPEPVAIAKVSHVN